MSNLPFTLAELEAALNRIGKLQTCDEWLEKHEIKSPLAPRAPSLRYFATDEGQFVEIDGGRTVQLSPEAIQEITDFLADFHARHLGIDYRTPEELAAARARVASLAQDPSEILAAILFKQATDAPYRYQPATKPPEIKWRDWMKPGAFYDSSGQQIAPPPTPWADDDA